MKYKLITEILKVTGSKLYGWDAEQLIENNINSIIEKRYEDDYGASHLPHNNDALDDIYSDTATRMDSELAEEFDHVAEEMNNLFREVCDKFARTYIENALDIELDDEVNVEKEDINTYIIISSEEISEDIIDDAFDNYIIDKLLETYDKDYNYERDIDLPDTSASVTYEPDIDWYQDEMQMVPVSFEEID